MRTWSLTIGLRVGVDVEEGRFVAFVLLGLALAVVDCGGGDNDDDDDDEGEDGEVILSLLFLSSLLSALVSSLSLGELVFVPVPGAAFSCSTFLPSALSILSQISTSYCVTKLTAAPARPARAVRPTR